MAWESLIYQDLTEPLRLLVQKPEGWKPGDKRTAVVWIHGGGWVSGQPEWFARHMHYFAGRGAVSFSVQYRYLSRAVAMDDCLADCRAAIAYIRKNARALGVARDKIAVAGDSSGGHLACCLGTPNMLESTEERANFVVALNAAVDLTTRFKDKVLPPPTPNDSPDAWLQQYQAAARLSPIFHVGHDNAPALIMHGLNDTVIPPEDSAHYHLALTAHDVDSTLMLLPNEQHAFILYDYQLDNGRVDEIVQDIDRHLTQKGFLSAE